MRVKHFGVRNLTSLIDVDLSDLPNLVVLIGKNSSGKSNLIDALALFFMEFGGELEISVGAQEYLFPNHDIQVNPAPEISATLSLTSMEWAKLFRIEQLPADTFESIELHLTKRIVNTSNGTFWKTHLVRFGIVDLVKDGEIEQIDTSLIPSIIGEEWPEGVQFDVRQFVSSIGPLLRSSFQILYTTESPRSWSNRFTERPTIIDSAVIEELRTLSQSTGMQRRGWSVVARRYEDLAPNSQRPVGVASSIQIEEDALSVPIGMTGEGSQAILRLIDQLLRGPQILAIEEPETHLHPAFIKKAGRLLTEASHDGKQLFVCTHSPFLVDQSSLDSFFVVKNEGKGTQVSPMREIDELRNLLLDVGMRPSDVLFCDAVLLVEGLSDETFLNALSNKLGAPLAERHVKVVSANGKSRGRYKIEFWAEVGQDAGIPLYVILDKDAKDEAERAIEKEQIPRERCLILSQGDLEDYYPWPAVEEAVSNLFGIEIDQPIAVGERVKELRELLSRKAKGNAWKPLLAEEVVRIMTSEDADSEMAEMVNFIRKIRDDLGVR